MTALIIAGINPIIYLTAIAGMIIPPYSALQEQKITDCRALKETNMAMTREMENLKYNNGRLKTENDELEVSVKR
jgi:cell division protein FtsB